MCPRTPAMLAAAASDEDLSVTLAATLRCKTCIGDRVLLVGDADALGAWDPSRGVELTTTPSTYPVYATGEVVLPNPGFVQFKFVRITADGTVHWEVGNNR